MQKIRVLIMGAAGRDFHNFNVAFRDNPEYDVVAFTATQIPNIEDRKYPPELAGKHYPQGIPIYPEIELESLIEKLQIDQVIFSYSDVSHELVMHEASRAMAKGADFRLLGARATMLKSRKPLVSVCAVRTGAGKSPASRKIVRLLKHAGLRVAVIRHPMPYGDLIKQAVQRFTTIADLKRNDCTIEEMEEYEPHLVNGALVYAGVDYEKILRQAEDEADIILWDGGNNDLPFYESDLEIVLVDPHRPNHERTYFPGEVNFLRADVAIISKINTADPGNIEMVHRNIRQYNPTARVIDAEMPITLENPESIRNKRVLVVEDGPTLTHGGMSYGAGVIAATKYGAKEIIDPRPYAVGSIKETFVQYPKTGKLLPAMGYGNEQMKDLEETINRTDCDLVIIGTPIDLRRIIQIEHPTSRLVYELEEVGHLTLEEVLRPIIEKAKSLWLKESSSPSAAMR
jgi:predicted GTPase